jgi:hypothetical protein
MLELRKNNEVMEVGDEEVMATFEHAVVSWNSETSGWDEDGNFWSVRELPDLVEYEPSR